MCADRGHLTSIESAQWVSLPLPHPSLALFSGIHELELTDEQSDWLFRQPSKSHWVAQVPDEHTHHRVQKDEANSSRSPWKWFLLSQRGWTCVDPTGRGNNQSSTAAVPVWPSAVSVGGGGGGVEMQSVSKHQKNWLKGKKNLNQVIKHVFVFYWHQHALPVSWNWFIQDVWMGHTMHPCKRAPWTHPVFI